MAHRYPSGKDPTAVLGRRFAAYAIDVVIIGIVGVILLSLAKHKVYSGAPANGCSDPLFQAELRARFGNDPTTCSQVSSNVYVWARSGFLRAWLITFVFAFLDLVVLQAITGAGIGKLFTGLRVVDRNGQKADFLAMLGRWIFLAIDAGIFVVGLITTLATHPHRRIGDLVCGTYVVATHSVGEPIELAAPGQVVATPPDSAASWPPAVVIPTVPTPSPTSLWTPTDAPPPVAPSPQWGSPPVRASSSYPPPPQPPPPPSAPPANAEPTVAQIHPPAIPAPWALPPEPQAVPLSPSEPLSADKVPTPPPTPPTPAPAPPSPPPAFAPPAPTAAPPSPAPAAAPAAAAAAAAVAASVRAPEARPEPRPGPTLESEPAPVRVTPPPAAAPPPAAKAPRPEPKPTESKPTEQKSAEPTTAEPKAAEPTPAERKPAEPKAAEPKAAEPKPAAPAATPPTPPAAAPKPAAKAPRPAPPRPKPPAKPAAQPARTADARRPETKAPPPEKAPAAAPPRWTPVAPSAAPETVADEWFELALSSDVADEEPDKK